MITNYEYITHFVPQFKGKTFDELLNGCSFATTLSGNITDCPRLGCENCGINEELKNGIPCSIAKRMFLNQPYKDQNILVKLNRVGNVYTSITGKLVGFGKDDNPIIEFVDDNISYYYTSADYELVVDKYAELKERIKKAKTDDRIVVYGKKRYFSHYEEENDKMCLYFFVDGTTSFSNCDKGCGIVEEQNFNNLFFVEEE